MKFLRLLAVFVTTAFILSSCQKELDYNPGAPAQGTLKATSGDCLPVTIYGTYQKDTLLNFSNTVDIQIDVTQFGSYNITTDTINGYSFSASGYAGVLGLNTIHLQAKGRPVAPEVDVFNVLFDTSHCQINVIVTGTSGSGGTSSFTLGGAGGACTGAVLAGTYTQGIPTTSAETVTLNVTVSTIGTWSLNTSANGVTFSGSGTFASTGAQTIQLNASGTPVASGLITYPVTVGAASCSFDVNYNVPAPAVFSLSGAPGVCTLATVAGTYGMGIPLSASNTVTVQVNVTSVGSYTITTNTANGFSFSKTGIFSTPGIQNVVLTGTGTPIAATTSTFTAGTGGCTFPVTVLGPAAYSFSGAPGTCTVATVNGTYTATVPLTSSNTVDVQVNVTTAGAYTISTSAGGMTFSQSGSFTVTGIQTVTLNGSGTPSAAGTPVFTVGTGGCTFTVTVAAAPSGIFHVKLNGVLMDYSTNAYGTYFTPGDLLISGQGVSPTAFSFDVDKSSTATTVLVGTYQNTLAASIGGGYFVGATYTDASSNHWAPESIFSTPDPFTIIITSITATRVIGTFSGTIRDNAGTGTNTLSVTEGVFDLPMQ